MGKWNGYHLAVGTGDRDPESVAASLHAELERVVPELYEYVESAYRERDRSGVWHEGDVVRWTTGESHSYGAEIIDLWDDDAVTEFDVPGEWALAVWQQEVEGWGGATLFARLDGRYVKIDRVTGRYGRGAEDAIAYFEREWGVEGRRVDDLPSQHSEASASTREGATASPEGGDSVASARVTELVGALASAGPTERRAVAEKLFVAVERDAVSFTGLPIPVLDALDDPETRFAAAATVREIETASGGVRKVLASGSPDQRRAAARYFACCDWADEETTRTLADALDDSDTDVRAAAANALRRRVERHGSRERRDAPPAPVGATPDLLDAARDDDPRVRADATLAAVQLAIYDGADDYATAAVESFAAAATDADETVRERVVDFCDVEVERLAEAAPDEASTRLVGALAEAESRGSDVDRWVTLTAMHVPRYQADLVRPILDDLVELGWRADAKSAFAREAVTTMAEEARTDFSAASPRDFAPVVDPLVDAVREGVAVESAVEVLRTVAESDADALDTETLERLLD